MQSSNPRDLRRLGGTSSRDLAIRGHTGVARTGSELLRIGNPIPEHGLRMGEIAVVPRALTENVQGERVRAVLFPSKEWCAVGFSPAVRAKFGIRLRQ